MTAAMIAAMVRHVRSRRAWERADVIQFIVVVLPFYVVLVVVAAGLVYAMLITENWPWLAATSGFTAAMLLWFFWPEREAK
ncbi:MAG: hypothetical protein HY294_05055 [Candidatus Rokubacteria bacterium]|nr:hypothetical protein [Candidatus Rokubacteria bacterium]